MHKSRRRSYVARNCAKTTIGSLLQVGEGQPLDPAAMGTPANEPMRSPTPDQPPLQPQQWQHILSGPSPAAAEYGAAIQLLADGIQCQPTHQ